MTTQPPENDAIPDETVHFDINLARLGAASDAIPDETVHLDLKLARLGGSDGVVVAEEDADDELERTRVSTRRRRDTPPAAAPTAAETDVADDLEGTAVVDRSIPARDDDDPERTTVVARRRAAAVQPSSDAAAETDGDDDDERTQVVDRSEGAEDTVIVDRGAGHDDTVVVPRSGASAVDDDDTALSKQAGVATPTPRPSAGALSAPVLRTRGDRRRGIAPPPVPAGFAPAAKAAVGPGAIDSYATRASAPAPQITPAPLGGIDATRDATAVLPSVGRRSERFGRIAVAAFAAACLVSVVGLIAIASTVL